MCKGDGVCQCASGFSGENCKKMDILPSYTKCHVSLYELVNAQDVEVFSQECGQYDRDEYTFYSNKRDFRDIVMNWNVKFDWSADSPRPPPQLLKYRPGIVDMFAEVKIYNELNVTIYTRSTIYCNDNPVSNENPHLIGECRDVYHRPSQGIKHNYRLVVNMYGKTGGYKEVHDSSENNVEKTYFDGSRDHKPMHIIFDLVPPTHCAAKGHCKEDELEAPIVAFPDLARKDKVTIIWTSWEDDDSGIKDFSYAIYKMEVNQNGKLAETDEPVVNLVWNRTDEAPTFKPDMPGTYSVILTVSDVSGNEMKARTLFIYDDDSSRIEKDADHALYVMNADPDSDYMWIHSHQTPDGEGESLNITWENHFKNKRHVETSMLEAVDDMSNGDWLDVYNDDNNRTKAEIPNKNGITNYKMAYATNIHEFESTPASWTDMGLEDFTQLPLPRKDGDMVKIWAQAVDVMGRTEVSHTTLQVDSSPPQFYPEKSSVQPNAPHVPGRPQYSTVVLLNVLDQHSGIERIDFTVVDVRAGGATAVLHEGSEPGQKVVHSRVKRQSSPGEACAAFGNCTCLADGKTCFDIPQKVYIDNCWLINSFKNEIRLNFTMYNMAATGVNGVYEVGKLENLRGPGEYPAIRKDDLIVANETLTLESAVVEWFYPECCYEVQSTVLKYKDHLGMEKELVTTSNSHQIDELQPSTEYTISAVLIYVGGERSEPLSVTFTTPDDPSTIVNIFRGLSAGAIAGIAICGILVILLATTLIIMLVRRRNDQPAIPESVRRAGETIQNRMSFWHGGHEEQPPLQSPPPYTPSQKGPSCHVTMDTVNAVYNNPSYVADDDVDIYGDMETDLNARWKFNQNRLQIGNNLPNANGRFADIKLATINTKHGKETVVAKMLKATHTREDERLMTAKMNFMGTRLKFHNNIVNFIGAIPDTENGPMLILEHCEEGRLSDWLKKQHQPLSEDNGDNMINFSIMIANGMEFLHRMDIVHRRLGARNVLLKEKMGSLHAKITGFGPMKGEAEGTSAKGKDMVPIKWMAPEQYEKPEGGSRIYSKDTDVWSYGVTLWEIFSVGETPYPGKSSNNVKKEVEKGYRLPQPETCTDFIYDDIISKCWNEKPASRPNFEDIAMNLKQHFDNCGRSSIYYADEEQEYGEEYYTC